MKEFLKSKKKMLIIILVIVAVILLVLGIFILPKNNSNGNGTNNSENSNSIQEEGNNSKPGESIKPTEVSTFEISRFEVKKNTPNEVNMVFKIVNKSKEDIKDKVLNINMYNGEKKLYTYGYIIEDLKISEYMYVQANAKFTYDSITKFEFQIDDSKVVIKPTYVD